MPATYVLPQVLVFQDFQSVPAVAANPLFAHISGPHAQLIRYAQADERVNGLLGYYDPLQDHSFDWPQLPAGATVDDSYTKLWVKDALLQYWAHQSGSGSAVHKLSGYNNRIQSAGTNFAANGTTYPRDTTLLSRDVKPGDVALVRGLDNVGNLQTLWTYVQAVHGSMVAASVASATADANNAATQTQSASVTQTAGDINCITAAVDGTSYDGTVSGHINETYDLLVTAGSIGGDLTKATVRVISGSGSDDQAAVTPAAANSYFAVGTRGLRFKFTITSTTARSESAASEGITPEDLVVGQRFHVSVGQAFTAPVLDSGSGVYAGTANTTYILTVSRGGLIGGATAPQVKVSTTTGYDLSGPTSVLGTGTGHTFAVGTRGVTGYFPGGTTELRTGDRYYITVTAAAPGPMRVLELGHNLNTNIQTSADLSVTLFIRNPLLQVVQAREGFAPLTNWDPSTEFFTVHSGMIAYDPSWTDNGVPVALPVSSEASLGYGEMFLEARYWLTDLNSGVFSIADAGNLDTQISGPLDPDNPLKWAVSQALNNSNGVAVKYTSVGDPSNDLNWAAVITKLLGRTDVYGLVPLTKRRSALNLFQAHVDAQSTPTKAAWRVLWTNLNGLPTVPVVSNDSTVDGYTTPTTSDGLVALGVVEEDPQALGVAYTILRCTSGNAGFITNGVAPGDVVRLLYTTDGFGNETWTEYVVDAVQSEDQLRMLIGPAAPIGVAAKFEIWRNLTADQEAAAIAAYAGTWADTRVRAIWPDTIESSGTVMDGTHLCAALAGLASGILPHQSMTHLAIAGFTAVPRTTTKFNSEQLDVMAGSGVWIVAQDLTGNATGTSGEIYTRQAVTTGNYSDINQREESVIRNVDSISFRFAEALAPFIGVANVTPLVQAKLNLEITNLIATLVTEASTNTLGGQLISGSITSFQQSATFKDRYVIRLSLQIPYALNNIELHLVV